jgi:hypothetical protein
MGSKRGGGEEEEGGGRREKDRIELTVQKEACAEEAVDLGNAAPLPQDTCCAYS